MIGDARDGFTQLDHMGLWASAPANQLETLRWIRSDQRCRRDRSRSVSREACAATRSAYTPPAASRSS
jgi:hypothetical protein